MPRPLALASRAWLCPFDPGPLTIALTITMPDAWANINATACLLMGSDPICATCDIRATVRAPRRTNIGPAIEAPRANLRFVFRALRARNFIRAEAALALRRRIPIAAACMKKI